MIAGKSITALIVLGGLIAASAWAMEEMPVELEMVKGAVEAIRAEAEQEGLSKEQNTLVGCCLLALFAENLERACDILDQLECSEDTLQSNVVERLNGMVLSYYQRKVGSSEPMITVLVQEGVNLLNSGSYRGAREVANSLGTLLHLTSFEDELRDSEILQQLFSEHFVGILESALQVIDVMNRVERMKECQNQEIERIYEQRKNLCLEGIRLEKEAPLPDRDDLDKVQEWISSELAKCKEAASLRKSSAKGARD